MVLNPGFELYNNCPTDLNQIYYTPAYDTFQTVIDWVNPLRSTYASYFNSCSSNPILTVAYSPYYGYQKARTGNAFAGIELYHGYPYDTLFGFDWREYVETRLSEPMQAGHRYYVSYYTNVASVSGGLDRVVSIEGAGARLTTTMIDSVGAFLFKNVLDGKPDIVSQAITSISDTAYWQRTSGIYLALGGEQWLTIGYFYANQPVSYHVLRIFADSVYNCTCFMRIDDVCVIDLDKPQINSKDVLVAQFPVAIGNDDTADEYKWSTGDTSYMSAVYVPGTYWRESWKNCQYYIDSFNIQETSDNDCIWLPTAFSPNNDGRNDFFGPEERCVVNYSYYNFSIFDRWGKRVFLTLVPGEKWDGKYNGILQGTDTYFYLLRYCLSPTTNLIGNGSSVAQHLILPQEKIYLMKGDLTLIR